MPGDLFHAVHTAVNMLGSVIRKAIRGKRTTYFREWRYRDNTLLGVLVIVIMAAIVIIALYSF